MANNVENVTVGKPAITGALYRAPKGTALPTDATTALSSAYTALGYISDAGLENANSAETAEIKAWGGDVVARPQSSKSDTFKATLIEGLNIEVLKTVYGDDNVIGSLATGITIKSNAKPQGEHAWVIEMIRGEALHRICIPHGTVSEIGTITYQDDDVVGYETTIATTPDSAGNTHYEYIKEA